MFYAVFEIRNLSLYVQLRIIRLPLCIIAREGIKVKKIIVIFILSVFMSACLESTSPPNPQPQFINGTPLQAAATVVQAIQQLQDGTGGLTPFINLFDSGGVRFSPYYYINNTDRVVNATEFQSDFILQNPPLRLWGTYDGSGDPINLNIRDYFSKFVWDYPYHTNATVTLINSNNDFNSQGNLINNMLSFYPLSQYRIVEYYQPGTNPANGGMDWSSLMVVLKNQGNNQWSLVGLVHGSWTI